jgi:putative lysine transport system substrate-binding protein
MIMRKKIIAIAAVATLMISTCFTGCSKKEAASDGTTTSDGKKVLKVGMECCYAPYNWTQADDSNGAIQIAGTSDYVNGFQVSVLKRVAEELGYDEIQVTKIDWDSIILGLNSSKYDCIPGICYTSERAESIDFTETYFYSLDDCMLVAKDGKYASATSLQDFDGASVVTQLSTGWEQDMEQIPNVDKQTSLSSASECTYAVSTGKVDAALLDEATCMAAIIANPDLTYISFEEGKGFTQDIDSGYLMGYGFRKGDENCAKFDEALKSISEDEYKTMMEGAIKNQPLSEE